MRSILDVGAEGAEAECEAFWTWVLKVLKPNAKHSGRGCTSTHSIQEVLSENEFKKYKSQEDRSMHHCRHPGPGHDRAAACSDVLTETIFRRDGK